MRSGSAGPRAASRRRCCRARPDPGTSRIAHLPLLHRRPACDWSRSRSGFVDTATFRSRSRRDSRSAPRHPQRRRPGPRRRGTRGGSLCTTPGGPCTGSARLWRNLWTSRPVSRPGGPELRVLVDPARDEAALRHQASLTGVPDGLEGLPGQCRADTRPSKASSTSVWVKTIRADPSELVVRDAGLLAVDRRLEAGLVGLVGHEDVAHAPSLSHLTGAASPPSPAPARPARRWRRGRPRRRSPSRGHPRGRGRLAHAPQPGLGALVRAAGTPVLRRDDQQSGPRASAPVQTRSCSA